MLLESHYILFSGAELMKRRTLLLQVALLGLVGCTGETTLVSLKVPNMH